MRVQSSKSGTSKGAAKAFLLGDSCISSYILTLSKREMRLKRFNYLT